jgi:hypothetical protein
MRFRCEAIDAGCVILRAVEPKPGDPSHPNRGIWAGRVLGELSIGELEPQLLRAGGVFEIAREYVIELRLADEEVTSPGRPRA